MTPSLESFQRQFILARTEGPAPSNFVADDLGAWRLLTHPDLGKVRVYDRDGARLGWLLGEAIDVANKSFILQEVRFELSVECETTTALASIASVIKEWAGWYLLVLTHPSLDCVVTDSGARLPCFFDETTGIIASSPALIMGLTAYERELQRDLLAAINIDGKGWLPFGLTALPHISRVLPNHRLRLGDLTVARVWPAGPIAVEVDDRRLVEAIARRIKLAIDVIAQPVGAWLPLTAGQESRTLLALSRNHVKRLGAFTVMHASAEADGKFARELALTSGIPHQALALVSSSESERQAWLTRTGHVAGDKNPRYYNTLRSLGPERPVLSGLGGGPARGIYWLRGDHIDRKIDPSSLLRRLDMPQHPTLARAASRWLRSAEHFDTFLLLDLAYIELRLGCWGAAPPFGPDFVYRDFCPLIETTVFELTLSLPREFRRSHRLAPALIAQEWPELLRLPFNRLPGLAHYVTIAKKATDPDRIRRRVRRLMG